MTSFEQANQSRRRCAVIYNPTKVSDKFHALVEDSLQRKGWVETLWLETSVEDPGRGARGIGLAGGRRRDPRGPA